MSEPSDQNGESDLPFLWHESNFDVAADLGYKDTVPTAEFTQGEYIHHQSEFDCSQRVEESGEVALRLTFHAGVGESSSALARDVSELLNALHEYDRAVGGKGLGFDGAASRAGAGWLSLVLRPSDQHGAADRFRQMAELLGSPITDAPPEAANDPVPNGILADVASLWEQTGHQRANGTAKTPDLMIPREQVGRYRVRFALVSRPHAA